jgi:signal transduction histidine kinase
MALYSAEPIPRPTGDWEQKRLASIAATRREMDNIEAVVSELRREIGNPINSVNMTLGMLGIKLQQDPRPALREYLERAREELRKVIDFLNALKRYGMPVQLESRGLRVDQLLASVVSYFQKVPSVKQITITHAPFDGVAYGRADPRLLQQVLRSACHTALDNCRVMASPAIAIKLDKVPPWIRIQIANNGPDLTRKQREDLFNPLAASNPPGVGLRLSLARKWMTYMNGTIELVDTNGQGICFDIQIPEDETADPIAEAQEAREQVQPN